MIDALTMESAVVPMAEAQAIALELGESDYLSQALDLLEQFGGDVAAALGELAENLGIALSALITRIEEEAAHFGDRFCRNAVEEFPGLVEKIIDGITERLVADYLHHLPNFPDYAVEPVAAVAGYVTFITVRSFYKGVAS